MFFYVLKKDADDNNDNIAASTIRNEEIEEILNMDGKERQLVTTFACFDLICNNVLIHEI